MNPLFIIPARGGSKGIPGKNIRPFLGKPLICHSIDHARALADDSDICVSTDSEEIAEVVRRYGLEIPFMRPASLATDTASSQDVLLHALNHYTALGRNYDTVVLLQPTSPLRTPDDIRACISRYTPDIDMAVTVRPAATNPYYNAFETDSQGYLHISKGDGTFTRRQDAPPVWEFNGAVYVINAQSLRTTPMGKFPKRVISPMSTRNSIDLDSPLDWLIAEYVAQNIT